MATRIKEAGEGIDLSFTLHHQTISEILSDSSLAALGDAYINFVYSLVQSQKKGRACGGKVSNMVLAAALRKSGLRGFLPSRSDRHQQANAAEALIVYAWIKKAMPISESVKILQSREDAVEGFAALLQVARSRLML